MHPPPAQATFEIENRSFINQKHWIPYNYENAG